MNEVDPKPQTIEEQKAAFYEVCDHVSAVDGMKVDTVISDPARLCFVSYDPDAVFSGGHHDKIPWTLPIPTNE